jgi:hypothetical protein
MRAKLHEVGKTSDYFYYYTKKIRILYDYGINLAEKFQVSFFIPFQVTVKWNQNRSRKKRDFATPIKYSDP